MCTVQYVRLQLAVTVCRRLSCHNPCRQLTFSSGPVHHHLLIVRQSCLFTLQDFELTLDIDRLIREVDLDR